MESVTYLDKARWYQKALRGRKLNEKARLRVDKSKLSKKWLFVLKRSRRWWRLLNCGRLVRCSDRRQLR